MISALCRDRRSTSSAGGGAEASKSRSLPSIVMSTPASRAARIASAALISVPSSLPSPLFPAQNEPENLRPYRPQRSRHLISMG